MSKVLKVILYVLLGLVVLAVVAGIFFAIFNGGHGYYMMRPGIRMMEPYRYGNFNLGRMVFGGLFALGLFLLVVIGIVALVSFIVRGNRPTQQPTAAQMSPASQEPAPAPMPTATRTCSNCGKPAQDDWKTCPYCGNPLS
jgi:predicted PurR-regulated permease PerM